MTGELWQQCNHRGCKTEPVCSACEFCKKHCQCEQRASDAQERAEFERAYPGVMAELEKHREQGAAEHD
jgi:hypothetical protein